ncbi:hypothetical protein DH2020_023733 [Rehmannia glutinosa]|uniref:Ripening-related protein n=1 Tax=Rehmannia glutinosa TaxID=99300 RepID=A0ABR0WB80_REHGL
MKNQALTFLLFLLFSILIMTLNLRVEAKSCKSSGKIKGKKPPKDQCNQGNNSDCCEQGKYYEIYKCSPKVSAQTKAVLTINGFGKGADGGGPSECDGKYHSDDTPIVALSTGWFNKRNRCFKNIIIHGNGKSVSAMVVDQCDSTRGAVWKALGVPKRIGVKWISTGLMLDQEWDCDRIQWSR